MKWLWCWRRKTEMPMLDDAEFAKVTARQPDDRLKDQLTIMLFPKKTFFARGHSLASN